MAHCFGESEGRLEWSCKNDSGTDEQEVLRLYAGEDPTSSLGEVVFEGHRTLAVYMVQGLEHRWVWPIAEDAEDLSEAIDAIRFLLHLRPGGLTHYFDISVAEDEDDMLTPTMIFMCERNKNSGASEQTRLLLDPMPQKAEEQPSVMITLQCQDLNMPQCFLTRSQATLECQAKGYNGAVLKEVRQPGNLHEFECVR